MVHEEIEASVDVSVSNFYSTCPYSPLSSFILIFLLFQALQLTCAKSWLWGFVVGGPAEQACM